MKKNIALIIIVMCLFISGKSFGQSKNYIYDNTAFVAKINVPENTINV